MFSLKEKTYKVQNKYAVPTLVTLLHNSIAENKSPLFHQGIKMSVIVSQPQNLAARRLFTWWRKTLKRWKLTCGFFLLLPSFTTVNPFISKQHIQDAIFTLDVRPSSRLFDFLIHACRVKRFVLLFSSTFPLAFALILGRFWVRNFTNKLLFSWEKRLDSLESFQKGSTPFLNQSHLSGSNFNVILSEHFWCLSRGSFLGSPLYI